MRCVWSDECVCMVWGVMVARNSSVNISVVALIASARWLTFAADEIPSVMLWRNSCKCASSTLQPMSLLQCSMSVSVLLDESVWLLETCANVSLLLIKRSQQTKLKMCTPSTSRIITRPLSHHSVGKDLYNIASFPIVSSFSQRYNQLCMSYIYMVLGTKLSTLSQGRVIRIVYGC